MPRVWAKLLAFERKHGLLKHGQGVVAAVSGGPDSVCLAHYLSRRSRKLGFPLSLAHVHHGLRGAPADRDRSFVLQLAMRLDAGIDLVSADVRALARKERRSLEDAARSARYAALRSVARKRGYPLVATAHTLSDHAETVILHLLRGTEPEGLLGIPVSRPLDAGRRTQDARRKTLVRPLLCLTRDEVMEYLRFFKLDSRVDETNRDEAFTRNWVRRRVIPLLKKKSPRLEQHLGLLSAKLASKLR